MSLFNFRIRRAVRDEETDRDRFARLLKVLDQIGAEMAHEVAGLQERYRGASSDAAYAEQALEEGRADREISLRIDDLTGTLDRYFERIALLQSQIAFFELLRSDVNAFARANHIDAAKESSNDVSSH